VAVEDKLREAFIVSDKENAGDGGDQVDEEHTGKGMDIEARKDRAANRVGAVKPSKGSRLGGTVEEDEETGIPGLAGGEVSEAEKAGTRT
jgi:hypothetical protein